MADLITRTPSDIHADIYPDIRNYAPDTPDTLSLERGPLSGSFVRPDDRGSVMVSGTAVLAFQSPQLTFGLVAA
jgi:hypothetical protein